MDTGAAGRCESSLLSTLRANVVLEKHPRLCPPAHLGGLPLKAAFVPCSFAFQHLSHPGKQRYVRGKAVLRGKATEKPRAALSLSLWAGGEGEEE